MRTIALVVACLACGAHALDTGRGEMPLKALASLLRARNNAFNPATLGSHHHRISAGGESSGEDFGWAMNRQPVSPPVPAESNFPSKPDAPPESNEWARLRQSGTPAQPAENFGWAKKRQPVASRTDAESHAEVQPAEDFGWAKVREPVNYEGAANKRANVHVSPRAEALMAAATSKVYSGDLEWADWADVDSSDTFVPPAEVRGGETVRRKSFPTAGTLALASAIGLAIGLEYTDFFTGLSDGIANFFDNFSP